MELVNNNILKITPKPIEKQFQPASLDWRIGAVEIFNEDTIDKNQLEYFSLLSKLYNADISSEEFVNSIDDFVDSCERDIRLLDKDESFIIEPGQQAMIYSLEQFEIPNWLSMSSELRSSNGRRGLSPVDGLIQNLSYDGRVQMSVVNKNPNPLRFYGGDRFAQLFFGVENDFSYVSSNTGIVKDMHNSQIMDEDGIYDLINQGLLEVSPDIVIKNNQLVFTSSDTAFSFKNNFGVIDTREKYSNDDLYDVVDISEPYKIFGNDLFVVKLKEQLKLSNQVGILLELSQSLNKNQLCNHMVGAGWVDPGYDGQVTIHDWSNHINMLKEDDVVMTGTVIYFPKPVGNSYGSLSLESHYNKKVSITVSV